MGRIAKLSESTRYDMQLVMESNPVYVAWSAHGREEQEHQLVAAPNVVHTSGPFSVVRKHVDVSATAIEHLWVRWGMDRFLNVIVEETPVQMSSL